MPTITKVKSNSAIENRNNYSRAIVVGDLIVLANTAGRDFKTREMPATAAGQAEQMFTNIEGALKAAGASMADVIRVRLSVPNPADMPAVTGIFARVFEGIEPVGTFTCCPLAGDEYLVEAEVTAYRGAGAMEVQRVSVVL